MAGIYTGRTEKTNTEFAFRQANRGVDETPRSVMKPSSGSTRSWRDFTQLMSRQERSFSGQVLKKSSTTDAYPMLCRKVLNNHLSSSEMLL